MKFLELQELDVLSRALNLTTPALKVSTRVEAYSCKAVSREKRLFKALESELIQDISHSTSVSPPEQHQGLLDSAFGPLNHKASRKTLWLLIGLLNVAFPDHDFSKVRPEEFRREESPRSVLQSLSAALDHLRSPSSQRSFSAYPPSSSFVFPSSPNSETIPLPSTTPTLEGDAIPTNPFLRQVLDPIIDLSECEVFSYTPDMDSDPHAAESDDEDSDFDEGYANGFEEDSDSGMAWEMDGVDSYSTASAYSKFTQQGRTGASWYAGGYGSTTPAKPSFSSFRYPPSTAPGTPTGSIAESFDDYSGSGLLWSTNYFLFNKRMKRILFISTWARASRNNLGDQTGRAKRRRSRSGFHSRRPGSVASVSLAQDDSEDEDERSEGEDIEVGVVASTSAQSMKRSASNASVTSLKVAHKKAKGKGNTTASPLVKA